MKMEQIKKEVNIKKVRLFFYISGTFFVFSVIFATGIFLKINAKDGENKNESLLIESKKVAEETYPRLIDGVLVEKNNINPPIAGVMIDNHVDARPPAGLGKAYLVFEAEAEGGITRYLAFFDISTEISKIGPVRSARPYFIEWAEEIKALYVHVGGSPAALVKMDKEQIFHLNEFYNGSYFWRGEEKLAPHNVFTSSAMLKEYADRNEVERPEFRAWDFRDESPFDERKEVHEISVDYRTKEYSVIWKYDQTNNEYIRFINGKPHETVDGDIIVSKNIAIMSVSSEAVDDKLRLEMGSIGNGEAVVCSEGECTTGVWEKTSSKKRTIFYNKDGSEIQFVRGNTWVEVVQPGYRLSY